MNGLVEVFRYKTWAPLRLIEYCHGLEDEYLDATTPGTFGTIRETLRHLVEAEEGYLSILTRERFASKAEAEAFVGTADRLPDGPVPLDELTKRIRRIGPHWEAMAQDADLPGRDVTTTDGWHLAGAVIMAQTIHHAGDHRSHVMSILGARPRASRSQRSGRVGVRRGIGPDEGATGDLVIRSGKACLVLRRWAVLHQCARRSCSR